MNGPQIETGPTDEEVVNLVNRRPTPSPKRCAAS